jgi:signal transduction histidine kinase
MKPHVAERRNLERQLLLARPLFLVLALVALLERETLDNASFVFLFAYLVMAVVIAVFEHLDRFHRIRPPFWVDLATLFVFLLLSPTVVSFWFLLVYVAYAAGIRWSLPQTLLLASVATLAVLIRELVRPQIVHSNLTFWLALAVGTFVAGAGASSLGAGQQRHAAEHDFLTRLAGMIRVDQGVAESLRQVLSELMRAFSSAQALIAVRDDELERIFVYRVHRGVTGRITPENWPIEKADAFLLDNTEANVCWNRLESSGEGFAWHRADGRPINPVPRFPGPSLREMGARSVMAVVVERDGQPTGRLLIINGDRPFRKQDLSWLERLARSLGPALENLYSLRHLRAKAIEAERTRFAHDLHDGILQTLLSFNIQLDVLRRKVLQSPERTAQDLAALQQTLKHESDELRRMVTDLRPLRVQSADLVDLMNGFADRFRQESGVALDLIADRMNLQLPDKVCRELFQIYREALHNVKKHAKATHVVVKLWQDEEKVTLVVDDNGQGFSFAGTFSSDELDRLRLGPISIKERTRSIGGVLTVESNPGHGARVTVEVPLS